MSGQPPAFSRGLLERLRGARRVAALTGAGASAESGIPTFRDLDGGLWSRYDPMELATPGAFRRNPRLVWDWYASRRNAAAGALPNAGHRMLAGLEERIENVTVVTQNVDGLHQRAGSTRVIELHGSILRVRCSKCGRACEEWSDDDPAMPPRCACGAHLRPDVVWFGEALPEGAMRDAQVAMARADVALVIGTSAVVQPAASLPVVARQAGAFVLEVNAEPTPLSSIVSESVMGRSGEILPALWVSAFGEEMPRLRQ
jgi:NAD-dependent deacetylase